MLPSRELGSGGAAKIHLDRHYFNKPLHFGKQDFTTGVRSRIRGGKSRVGTGT